MLVSSNHVASHQQYDRTTPPTPPPPGANGNGAIIHYRAEASTCATVDASTLLLVDSGGQYDCGTTDITRTMHFGTPSAHQRQCYTRVLQGHIGLDSAVFPEQTPGIALDAFARRPLWGMGLNYRHGTGHGVGAALNVHEGPQSISTRWHITTPLQRGMIVRWVDPGCDVGGWPPKLLRWLSAFGMCCVDYVLFCSAIVLERVSCILPVSDYMAPSLITRPRVMTRS